MPRGDHRARTGHEQARRRLEEHRAAELRVAELRRRNDVLGDIDW